MTNIFLFRFVFNYTYGFDDYVDYVDDYFIALFSCLWGSAIDYSVRIWSFKDWG